VNKTKQNNVAFVRSSVVHSTAAWIATGGAEPTPKVLNAKWSW